MEREATHFALLLVLGFGVTGMFGVPACRGNPMWLPRAGTRARPYTRLKAVLRTLHSEDLVNWEIVSQVIPRLDGRD